MLFEGRDILAMSERELREMRGNRVGMIFQEPMTSLNPLHTVEKQLNEVLLLHRPLSQARAWPSPWSGCAGWGSATRRGG